MGTSTLIFGIPALVIGIPLLIIIFIYLIMPIFRGIGFIFGQIGRFIGHTLGDAVRLVGIILTAIVLANLALGNIVIGRWSAAQHFGRAIQAEFSAFGACLYRLAIGHWVRLFCLTPLVEGIEQRIPQAVNAAPGPTISPNPIPGRGAPAGSGRTGQFEGYDIIGTLAGGGSGGRLYIARPTPIKQAAFERQGFGPMGSVGDVVIKSFSVREGSSLPQIVRESRALEAAKKLGLVLEHELTPERFFYVMRYVPGDALGIVATRLHAAAGPGGLDHAALSRILGFSVDLVATLDRYHRAGLWHKDIKPDNIIVSTLDGRAHLVDFGLLTPLRSSLTLTTHGTEYFRDPEMVRLALKGVKVHEVDGARFDIYGAGAVIFSIVENSFPAHGGLSQLTRRCPDALRWIVRRAMTDYDKRYPSAALMLADLRAVAAAPDPFSLKPADLPSMSGLPASEIAAAAVAAPAVPHADPLPAFASPVAHTPVVPTPAPRPRPVGVPAEEQVRRARERAAAMSARAQSRFGRRSSSSAPRMPATINAGVLAAVAIFLLLTGAIVGGFMLTTHGTVTITADSTPRIEVMVGSGRDDPADDILHNAANKGAKSLRDERAARRNNSKGGVDAVPVVILRDKVAFEDAFAPIARDQVQRLRDAGFRIVADEGDGSAPIDRDPDALKAANEALAAIHKAVGVYPLGAADAHRALVAWLDGGSITAPMVRPHLVVWFARHPADAARMMAWVVPSKVCDPLALAAAKAALSIDR